MDTCVSILAFRVVHVIGKLLGIEIDIISTFFLSKLGLT